MGEVTTGDDTSAMAVETKGALQSPRGDVTEAGNYFVANYPPFSFWNVTDLPKVRSQLEAAVPNPPVLGLYAHIPFCRKRCHFCYFRVYTDKNSLDIGAYLNAMVDELEHYAGKPYLRNRLPEFVYFGGGTPSYLSERQLRRLIGELQRVLNWEEVEEVTFECEPGTLSGRKLEVIGELGTTRLSLGIENFDDEILEVNGRAHRSREIFRAYGEARSCGFPQINVDLIAGMIGESEENWRRCVEKTIELEPDSVTIYQMEIPFNTTVYRGMRETGTEVAPVAGWKQKREWVHYAFHRMEEAGYTVTSGYTAVRNPDRTRFLYRDHLWRGADLVALGVASFGHLGGHHYQNATHFQEYLESVNSGALPVMRAYETTVEERLVRELILQMKLGRVDGGYFKAKFGVSIRQRFEAEFAGLEQRGLVELVGDEIRFSREALLRIDSFLEGFFLPRHRKAV